MEYNEHVEKLLDELESDTGIRFSIDDNNNNQSETIKKLSRLIHRFKGDENRGFFFRQFLLGQLSRDEISEKRLLYHMDQNQPWAVFLIAFAKPYEPYALRVISSLFAPGADHTVEMDRTHLVVIRQLKTLATDGEIKEMAEAIMGTLGTEAMLSVKVSYDRCCEDLSGLPLSYQHCNQAMEVGRLFMEGDNIFGYHELGLGKLRVLLHEQVGLVVHQVAQLVDHHDVDQPVKLGGRHALVEGRHLVDFVVYVVDRPLELGLEAGGKKRPQRRDAVGPVGVLLQHPVAEAGLAAAVGAYDGDLSRVAQHVGLLAVALVRKLNIHNSVARFM